MSWFYQEWSFVWSLWAFGYERAYKGGWDYDTLTIAFGPFRWTFLGEKK